MPISPEAIERFLIKPIPILPQYKGVKREVLLQRIAHETGCEYAEMTSTEERPHQLEGVAFALVQRRALLYYWMRLGKTKIALDWCSHLRRAGMVRKKGLVIAHAPIGAEVWPAEAAKHSLLSARVISAGGGEEQLLAAMDSDCDLIVIPHSMIQTMFSVKRLNRKGENKLGPDYEAISILAGCFDHAIIDEVHLCSQPDTLRFSLARSLVQGCPYRLALTGTPVGRNLFDVWAQAYLIDEGRTLGQNYHFFEAAFGVKKRSPFTRTGFTIKFDKAKMPILHTKLASISLAYGKGEIKSAEVFAGVIELRMSEQQREAYNSYLDRLIKLRTDDEAAIENAFVRLRQISSGYLPFKDGDDADKVTVKFKKSAKIEWLREFLETCPHDVQVVVFHEYIQSGQMICELLEAQKRSYAWLYGGTSNKELVRERFRAGKVQFLVANSVAGGTAIDLPMADYLLFYESPVSPRVREQAQARPMARSVDRPLMVDDLICSPVENKILGFLQQGKTLNANLIQGGAGKFARSLFAK